MTDPLSLPQTTDQDSVAFLKHIRRPGECVEIRVLEGQTEPQTKPVPYHAFFTHEELDQLPEALGTLTLKSYKGIYYTLNPVAPTLHAYAPATFVRLHSGTGANEGSILQRGFLPIDIDPRRQSNSAATEDEHAHALALGQELIERLGGVTGDVLPFVVDSGNGCQILFPLASDIPAEESPKLITDLLDGLHNLSVSTEFSDYGCDVDTSVGNASRIMRLPGTWNRKGESTDERPHRLARLLSAPETGAPGLSADQLAAMRAKVTAMLPVGSVQETSEPVHPEPALTPQPIDSTQAEVSRQTVLKFMRDHFLDVVPNQNYTSSNPPMKGTLWAVWCPMDDHENQSASVILYDDGHVVFRCQHNHCREYRWDDFVKKVASNNAEAQEILARTIASNLVETPEGPGSRIRSLLDLRNAPRPDLEEVELLKDKYLTRGQVSMIVAETGVGKSSFTMQAAILWAMGKPCFDIRPAKPLSTLIVQGENCDEDLLDYQAGIVQGIQDRGFATNEEVLTALGRVQVVTATELWGDRFAKSLDETLRTTQVDLVVIDPLYQYIGNDVFKQGAVSKFLRQQLQPVVAKHHVGVILVHHTPKPTQFNHGGTNIDYNHTYDGAGTSEISNFVRGVLVLNSKQDDDGNKVFALTAAKRGERLGWKDSLGNPTCTKWILWHQGYIFWEDAPADLVARVSNTARRQAQSRREAQELQDSKIAQFIELLQADTFYPQVRLEDLLQSNRIETNTARKSALIHQAVTEGHLLKVEMSKDEKVSHQIPTTTKNIYRLP